METSDQLADPVTTQDHAMGPADAPIIIVEYGDYECSSCLNALPILQEVRTQLGERLRFVFRHFPRSSIHPHASIAAEAAEAAGDQGKFWEMHEALFKNQKRLGELDLTHLALTIGLELYKFETSRAQPRHRNRVKAHFESAERHGLRKTPTLFINNRRYTGPMDAASILAAVGS